MRLGAIQFKETMYGAEAALTDVTLAPPPKFDDAAGMKRSYGLEGRPPFNIARAPALATPMGFTTEGLPISIQVVGRAFDEASVYRGVAAYEGATDWKAHRPSL